MEKVLATADNYLVSLKELSAKRFPCTLTRRPGTERTPVETLALTGTPPHRTGNFVEDIFYAPLFQGSVVEDKFYYNGGPGFVELIFCPPLLQGHLAEYMFYH